MAGEIRRIRRVRHICEGVAGAWGRTGAGPSVWGSQEGPCLEEGVGLSGPGPWLGQEGMGSGGEGPSSECSSGYMACGPPVSCYL